MLPRDPASDSYSACGVLHDAPTLPHSVSGRGGARYGLPYAPETRNTCRPRKVFFLCEHFLSHFSLHAFNHRSSLAFLCFILLASVSGECGELGKLVCVRDENSASVDEDKYKGRRHKFGNVHFSNHFSWFRARACAVPVFRNIDRICVLWSFAVNLQHTTSRET